MIRKRRSHREVVAGDLIERAYWVFRNLQMDGAARMEGWLAEARAWIDREVERLSVPTRRRRKSRCG